MANTSIEPQACSTSPKIRPVWIAVTVSLVFGSLMLGSTGCVLWNPGAWSDVALVDPDRASPNDSDRPVVAQKTSAVLSRGSRDSINLVVEFRHLRTDQLGPALWSEVDETAFPASTRRRWLDNGMRIGLIPSTGLAAAGRLSADSAGYDPVTEFLSGVEVLGDQPDGSETISLRASQRHELPLCRSIEGEATVLYRDGPDLVGRNLHSPQFLLALTATKGPREGQATLQIRPEIQYGAMRQQFVSSDSAVRIHAGRKRWELAELNMTWVAQPNATVVVAPAIEVSEGDPTYGLGRLMLKDDHHMHDDQHIVAFLRLKLPQ